MTDVLRLVAVSGTAIDPADVVAAVAHAGAGGVVSFVGVVRAEDEGRTVTELEYVAHPDALDALRAVAASVARDLPVLAIAAVHRTGVLSVGEVAVVVAAAAPHRAEAFEATRRLIDELKATVPIWKRQVFVAGASEWVGSP